MLLSDICIARAIKKWHMHGDHPTGDDHMMMHVLSHIFAIAMGKRHGGYQSSISVHAYTTCCTPVFILLYAHG